MSTRSNTTFELNKFEKAQPLCARYARHVGSALDYVDATPTEKAMLFELLRRPESISTAYVPSFTADKTFRLVQGNRVRAMSWGLTSEGLPVRFRHGGGSRALPGANLAMGVALTQRMHDKLGLFGVPVAGAKFTADVDLGVYTEKGVRQILSGCMEQMAGDAGPGIDVWAGDKGISGPRLGYLQEGYEIGCARIGRANPGLAVAGLQGEVTAEGRDESTGFFQVECLRLKLVADGIPMGPHIRVAVHGFGAVGKYAALRAHQLGWTVVAATDDVDGFVDQAGLDVLEAIAYVDKNHGKLSGWQPVVTTEWMDPEDFWDIENVLALLICSTENVITALTAPRIKAKYVSPAANMAADEDGEADMQERGIEYGSEAHHSGGGALGSYLGTVQQANNTVWPAGVMLGKLYRFAGDAHADLLHMRAERAVPTNSLAATVIGLERDIQALRCHFV